MAFLLDAHRSTAVSVPVLVVLAVLLFMLFCYFVMRRLWHTAISPPDVLDESPKVGETCPECEHAKLKLYPAAKGEEKVPTCPNCGIQY